MAIECWAKTLENSRINLISETEKVQNTFPKNFQGKSKHGDLTVTNDLYQDSVFVGIVLPLWNIFSLHTWGQDHFKCSDKCKKISHYTELS